MLKLATAVILAAFFATHSAARHPDAVEVYHWRLSSVDDVNYDNWPDRWRRYYGPGLPQFVEVELAEDEQAVDETCLAVRVNGGGAHVESPHLSVSNNYSYKLEARLNVEGLRHSQAQLRLEFCDNQRRVLQIAATDWFRATDGWRDVEIEPVNVVDPEIRLARLSLYVKSGERVDLHGAVMLDDVWIGRLPRMDVRTNSPFNVYENPKDVEVVCELSGIQDQDPDILFMLLDASSHAIDEDRVKLDVRLINERKSKSSDIVGAASGKDSYAGSTSWRPPIREHGFYKVAVLMQSERGVLMDKTINIAVVPPLEAAAHGPFGWSLAGDEIPLSYDQLGRLLPRVAVNWVKLPVWYGPTEQERGDELVVLTERLSAQDIEVVGVVDRPPADSELAAQVAAEAAIADTLSLDPSNWLPLLDPVLTRLSLRVRWWQLGNDSDMSYSGFPSFESEIARLRGLLFRFGQDVNLGVAWHWLQSTPKAESPSWEFEQLAASPPLTSKELAQYLQLPPLPGVDRWVLIHPLSRRQYDLETRARNLVREMLSAKIHGAKAIFAARPFDDDAGLMTDAGMPGELLLPWRTTASLLSATTFIGSIQLPGGSENRLFETPTGEVLMVIWNDRPTQETLHLGDDVAVVDVFGRSKRPRQEGRRQVIEVTALPKFVRGLNPFVAKWRMQASFAEPHIPSVFGKSHRNRLQMRNTFNQGVGGAVRLVAPEGWQLLPDRLDFKLAEGETSSRLFEVSLPFDANTGPVPIRADFTVNADQRYQFSVYRELKVGDGQVELEVHTRLDNDGWLIVEQRMANYSPQMVDFKCLLLAQGRRRQRVQVFRLGRSVDVKIYRYPNGAELIGTALWLRAEEVNGTRVLNHQFIAEQ